MKNNLFNSGKYYDLFYKDKDYISEAEYINKKLSQYNPTGKSLLELGYVTGKHALILSKLGYEILGIEQSESMIKSIPKVRNFECKKGDIRNIKIDKKFDTVISLFHVISYQVSNESLKSVLNTAFNQLKDNGIFLFDFWFAPAVIHQKPCIKIKSVASGNSTIIRIAEPELLILNNLVNVKYTFYELNHLLSKFSTYEEIHPMRYFTIPELEYFANTSGFQLLEAEEFLTSKNPSLDTWGVCIILRKNG